MAAMSTDAEGTADVAAEKKALRATVRAVRKARRRAEKDAGVTREVEARAIADAILAHLDTCPQARAAGWGSPTASVAVFRSTPSEPDTSALLDALHARGVRLLVPRTQDDLTLDWHELLPPEHRPDRPCPTPGADTAAGDDARAELPGTDDTGDEGPALGVDAVADVTAMIQPGIAVDADGHRLGQGGGCYDRTIPRLRPDTCRAVLLFDDEILDAVPHEPHDQPVPAVVTPRGGWRALGPA